MLTGGSSPHGGGIASVEDSHTTLVNCIFWENEVEGVNNETAQVYNDESSTTIITFSCIQGCTELCTDQNDHNFPDDPLFATGPAGDHYLSWIDAGQSGNSPCIDAGCCPAQSLFVQGTTRTDHVDATGVVDIGYHYSAALQSTPVWIVPSLDIKPGSCPNSFNVHVNVRGVKSGVLPVALVGSDEFDVEDVDVTSLALARADSVGGSVAPLNGPPGPGTSVEDMAAPFTEELCACHTVGSDGIIDLSLKFSRAALVDQLLLVGFANGEAVELVLTGMLTDGTPFEARDCVVIVN